MKNRTVLAATVAAALSGASVRAERPKYQPTPPPGWEPQPAQLQSLKARPNGVRIEFAVLPGQWRGADLWTHWGDAVYASDGNFYCSAGDHSGKAGNAFVYRVDPEAGTVELVFDFAAALGGAKVGTYTPGKIHGPLVEHDGWLYFSGYRGAVKYTTDAEGYDGDPLMRYELATGEVENLGIPVPETSHPEYGLVQRDGKLFFCGLGQPGRDLNTEERPQAPETFFVYDVTEGKLVYHGGPEPNQARAFVLTPDGRAYWSIDVGGSGRMAKYDPATNRTSVLDAVVPDSGIMRASTRVGADGVAYGLTRLSGTVFAFDTNDETVRTLGDIVTWPVPERAKKPGAWRAYTADLQFAGNDESTLVTVPHSHGGAEKHGTPVVRFDLKRNRASNLCELKDVLVREVKYVPMGSYGAAFSEDGKTMLIVWNGCYADWQTGRGRQVSFQDSRREYKFDVCAVTLLHLP